MELVQANAQHVLDKENLAKANRRVQVDKDSMVVKCKDYKTLQTLCGKLHHYAATFGHEMLTNIYARSIPWFERQYDTQAEREAYYEKVHRDLLEWKVVKGGYKGQVTRLTEPQKPK